MSVSTSPIALTKHNGVTIFFRENLPLRDEMASRAVLSASPGERSPCKSEGYLHLFPFKEGKACALRECGGLSVCLARKNRVTPLKTIHTRRPAILGHPAFQAGCREFEFGLPDTGSAGDPFQKRASLMALLNPLHCHLYARGVARRFPIWFWKGSLK